MGISVIIITKNEAANIGDCLDSAASADEIVVVDSGSTDGTVDIARAKGARVLVTEDWPGFGAQKQRALDLATQDWVLSLDADERIPADLWGEISRTVGSSGHAAYRMKRLSWFLGQPLRHGGWYPDRVVRLARRSKAHFSDDIVHERLIVDGSIGEFETPMMHYSYQSVDDIMRKMHTYVLASAASRVEKGVGGGMVAAVSHSAYAFFNAYILRAGLLDGWRGFAAAALKSHETFWRYIAVGMTRSSSADSAQLARRALQNKTGFTG